MTRFLMYLRVRFLKAIKLYPVVVCFTIILALGIGLVFGNMLTSRSESESNTKFKIGLVGDTSDSYLGIGVFAVTNFDVSKEYSEFVEMTEADAKKQLANNDIMGYVKIPDGFVDAVVRGENIDIKFITNKKPALLGTLIIEEICYIVSDLVVSSQNGIYGFADYAKDLSRVERSELIDKINIEYIACVFDRDSAYEMHEIGYANNISFEEYYICSLTVILILLWGMCCGKLLVKRDHSLTRSLMLDGRGVFGQIIAEFIPFFMVIFANILLLLSVLGIFIELDILTLSFLPSLYSLGSCVSFAFEMIPAIILLTALQYLLYEISWGIISAIVLQVFSTIALSFVSGLIFPIYSLPSLLQSISVYLPTTISFDYLSDLIKVNTRSIDVLIMICYAIALLLIAVAVRFFRVRSDRYA